MAESIQTNFMNLELKQRQFNSAMELFENRKRYKLLGILVSIINISLQIYTLSYAFTLAIGFWWQIISLITAYLITDFVNGLVHLYMDDNENYDSLAGPFIANFHLHHRTPRYQDNNLLIMYFNETGSKIWLVFYLVAVAILFHLPNSNPFLLYTMTYVGILSSIAEISHYLCHNSNSAMVMFLIRLKLLLPKREHAIHHTKDNASYAFLNGITNPLVDFIAKMFFTGYKNKTDLHYAKYSGSNMPRR
ncbi:MAG: fatty acid desaturase CarF family protein [Syntrophus sp. (in: bacteria)]